MMKINPVAVFREEFDGSGCLFNPDDGSVFGMNRTACLIWKRLSEGVGESEIVAELQQFAAPGTAVAEDVAEFIKTLRERGFIGDD